MILITLVIAALALLLFAIYLETRIDRDTEMLMSDLEDEVDALEDRVAMLEEKLNREEQNDNIGSGTDNNA